MRKGVAGMEDAVLCRYPRHITGVETNLRKLCRARGEERSGEERSGVER
jgi:cytochrome b